MNLGIMEDLGKSLVFLIFLSVVFADVKDRQSERSGKIISVIYIYIYISTFIIPDTNMIVYI